MAWYVSERDTKQLGGEEFGGSGGDGEHALFGRRGESFLLCWYSD